MTPAAQYLRMSSDQQRYSLEVQASTIAAYAQAQGYQVVRSYEDAGKSGVTSRDRYGLRDLLKDVHDPRRGFSTILVLDVSRWGRFQDPDEAAHYEFMCRQQGVRVEYCDEAFSNDGSSSSFIVKSLKRVMAADYSRQLSVRSKAGLRRTALAGLKLGGRASYGSGRQAFNPDGTAANLLADGERRSRTDQSVRLVPGPEEEQANVREIFRLFTQQGYGKTEIARSLNARGRMWRDGTPWNYPRINCVLTNEIALGVFVFARSSSQLGIGPVRTERESWIRASVLPPLVTQQAWRKAQAKMRDLKGRSHTDEEILARLRRLLSRKGELSRRLIDESPLTPRASAYTRRYGSLRQTFALIGYDPPKRFRRSHDPATYDDERVVESLRRALASNGYLTADLITDDPQLPSVSFLRRRYGSLLSAYRLAGYEVDRPTQQRTGWERRRLRLASTEAV